MGLVDLFTEDDGIYYEALEWARSKVVVRRLPALGRLASTSRVTVIHDATPGLRHLDGATRWARVTGQKVQVVALVAFERRTAASLATIGCRAVVWLDQAHDQFEAAVTLVSRSGLRNRMRSRLEILAAGDPLLLDAVDLAFRSSGRASVAELAKGLHTVSSTLRQHWYRRLPGSPVDLIRWVRLLSMVEAGRDTGGRYALARSIGVHHTTLHRLARSLVGVSPGYLDAQGVEEAFEIWLSA